MSEQEQQYYRNLLDAGCSPKTADGYIALFHDGKNTELLRGLAVHRRRLLEKLHADQKQIDCFDYLIFQIQKNTGRI